MPNSRPYKVGLNERLTDAEYAAAYLNAARRESQEVFLLALRDVAEVHTISRVAEAAGVNRETLYRTLSVRGNPTLATLASILEALGLEPEYHPRRKRKRSVAAGSLAPVPQFKAPNEVPAIGSAYIFGREDFSTRPGAGDRYLRQYETMPRNVQFRGRELGGPTTGALYLSQFLLANTNAQSSAVAPSLNS